MAKREIIVEWNQKWWENIIIRYMIVEYLKRDGFVFNIDAH